MCLRARTAGSQSACSRSEMTSKASTGGTGSVTSEWVSTTGLVEHGGEFAGGPKSEARVEPKRGLVPVVDVEAAHRNLLQQRAAHVAQRRTRDAATALARMCVDALDLHRLRRPCAQLRLE